MKRKYGLDTYIIGGVIITTHLCVIVAKFMGKDLGMTIPESLDAIQRQIEQVALAYMMIRSQKQVNNAHQRVNLIKKKLPQDNPFVSP